MCDKEEREDMSAVKIAESNKKISDSLLNIRRIAQQQMKKHGQTYDDVLKVVKEYRNGR
ncbi:MULTISPECIES: hypothetical protein [unclassified Sporolactobacillus]|uniref:hypothetical protein n=1 Tax=unclassified Sporolactobacillus TaxID=2628533 RepID=UPI002368DF29|nr:hypothetical protein [Sporolactobacillus sp. CQH2019]MDD9149522.1 hypothetical protein [Sporolactobacillus sp. CQH2019]